MIYRIAGILVAFVALVLASTAIADVAVREGKIMSADLERQTIMIAEKKGDQMSFKLADGCEIKLDGRAATLADLGVGTTVSVTTQMVKHTEVASKIEAFTLAKGGRPLAPTVAHSGS